MYRCGAHDTARQPEGHILTFTWDPTLRQGISKGDKPGEFRQARVYEFAQQQLDD